MMKRIRTPISGKKLSWSTVESLSLGSERIDDFLDQRVASHDEEHAKATDFFRKIRLMMDDSNWIITTKKAEFRALNRTGGTIRSIRGTVAFEADRELFYTLDVTRAFIEENKQFEISEDIRHKVYEVAGVIRNEYGEPCGLKRNPELSCGFREYTIEIFDSHRMFNNSYVRGVAGIVPMKKNYGPFEEFVKKSGMLGGEFQKEAGVIVENINRVIKVSSEKSEIAVSLDGFIGRYFPTLNKAMDNYLARPDEKKGQELHHSLEVMSISTDNLHRSLSGSEDDITSIEQNIMEQQLIREGLYSPFDKNRDR